MQQYKGYRCELKEIMELEKQLANMSSYIQRRKNYLITKLTGQMNIKTALKGFELDPKLTLSTEVIK